MKRILIVDDSARDMELALNALDQAKLRDQVIPIREGSDALDYLFRCAKFSNRTDPDPAVILLDLKMPRVDGLEILRRVKSDPRLRVIPVIMMTSSREQRDLVDSYKLGVNAYVVKPLRFAEFISVVKALGIFWASMNLPPPQAAKVDLGI